MFAWDEGECRTEQGNGTRRTQISYSTVRCCSYERSRKATSRCSLPYVATNESPVESKWVLCPKVRAQSNGIDAIRKTVCHIEFLIDDIFRVLWRLRRPLTLTSPAAPLDGPIERKSARQRTWLGIGIYSIAVGNLRADPQRWNSLPKRSKWDKKDERLDNVPEPQTT